MRSEQTSMWSGLFRESLSRLRFTQIEPLISQPEAAHKVGEERRTGRAENGVCCLVRESCVRQLTEQNQALKTMTQNRKVSVGE